MAAGELGALFDHVSFQVRDQRRAERLASGFTLIGDLATQGPLDLEQGVDPADDLHGHRRDDDLLLARRFAPRVLFQIGHGEEWAPCMDPAGGFQDGAWLSIAFIELAVSAEGVGLKDAAVARQMPLRMLALPIA